MMAVQQQTIYETWDDVEPPDWVHSRLYALEPSVSYVQPGAKSSLKSKI